ncbi:glycosyltransferase [Paenibacillus chartarius]|uniref:Glycosyltransferase n=1 Tax=Paenibacillus chartarius TaxID=747481 RepID=A0ABV6DJR9_9BACL
MTTFSVCLIVKNEENNIRRVLRSIPKSCEVIVGDTGSTDRTKDIARNLRAKVFDIPWNHDFAEARNAAAAFASGDYILFLDADEELQAGAESALKAFVRKHPKQAGAVAIRNLIGDEVHVHLMARFYPNNGEFQYAGKVHETIFKGDQPAPCLKTGVTIHHYGYDHGVYEAKGKAERYFQLYESCLASDPNNGYMLYQLGKLHFSLKQYEQAEAVLNKGVLLEEEQQLYFPVMLVMLGYTLKNLNRSQEAELLLEKYAAKYSDFPDLPFLLGLLAMDTGKLREIETYFLRALAIGDSDIYTSVHGTGTFKAAYNLGVYYEITGQTDKAFQYYRKAAQYQYAPAKQRLQILRKHL